MADNKIEVLIINRTLLCLGVDSNIDIVIVIYIVFFLSLECRGKPKSGFQQSHMVAK